MKDGHNASILREFNNCLMLSYFYLVGMYDCTQTKKDLSELSEVIDRLQEDIRIKQVNLDEANETLFVMEDSVEQHIAIKKHDNHTIQRLQNQISDLRVRNFLY